VLSSCVLANMKHTTYMRYKSMLLFPKFVNTCVIDSCFSSNLEYIREITLKHALNGIWA